MEPTQLDSLLRMMTLRELEEALEVVRSWEGDGTVDPGSSRALEQRIQTWLACHAASEPETIGPR
jgi:hypothetical protein